MAGMAPGIHSAIFVSAGSDSSLTATLFQVISTTGGKQYILAYTFSNLRKCSRLVFDTQMSLLHYLSWLAESKNDFTPTIDGIRIAGCSPCDYEEYKDVSAIFTGTGDPSLLVFGGYSYDGYGMTFSNPVLAECQ